MLARVRKCSRKPECMLVRARRRCDCSDIAESEKSRAEKRPDKAALLDKTRNDEAGKKTNLTCDTVTTPVPDTCSGSHREIISRAREQANDGAFHSTST